MKKLKVVNGLGTDLGKKESLKKRAQKKLITQSRVLKLIDVAKRKGATNDQLIPYWNTYNCLKTVYSSEGRLYGRYCKNRFCTVCCAIRKAELILKYLPQIRKWKDPHFVTLTVKSVPHYQLKKMIYEMFIAFNFIKDKYRKGHSKGKRMKLMGIKSLECNFNPVKQWYNPHFHFIVPDESTANLLIQEWQKYWGYKITSRRGQDKKKITNPKKCLIEVIKYGVKTFTDPDMIKDKNAPKRNPSVIYAAALHNVICAMKGHRIFERFGFNTPKADEVKLKTITKLIIYQEWLYDIKNTDWISEDSALPLTEYKPPSILAAILENCIDDKLE